MKIEMRRPKTKVRYSSLLWHDPVEALNSLLLERPQAEHLFVTQYGTPIDESDIQEAVRRLADLSGLEPSKEGIRIYRIRPHALRHYFKTSCTNISVDNKVSEFLLGHTVDELGYEEFMETERGEQLIRAQTFKAAPLLNVLTRRGVSPAKDSYFETMIETIAISRGMDPEEVKKQLLYFAEKMPTYNQVRTRLEGGKKLAMGHLRPEHVVPKMTKEELFPAVLSLVKSLSTPTTAKPDQKVILEG